MRRTQPDWLPALMPVAMQLIGFAGCMGGVKGSGLSSGAIDVAQGVNTNEGGRLGAS